MPSFLLLSAVEILLDQFQHLLRTVLYLCTQGSILVRTQFGNNPINHCRTEHMILLKDSTSVERSYSFDNIAILLTKMD